MVVMYNFHVVYDQQDMERWKALPGYKGCYEVSDQGRVKSLPRWVNGPGGTPRLLKERIIKPGCGDGKYLSFGAHMNNECMTVAVHRAVAELFVENPLHLNFVNHKDGDKRNNRHSNLEWVLHADNCDHAYAIGLRTDIGQKHKKAKLTIEQVKSILTDRSTIGLSQNQLAAKYGTTRENIRLIVNGKSWVKALQFDALKRAENDNA